MTSSAHGAAGPWGGGTWAPEGEGALVGDESEPALSQTGQDWVRHDDGDDRDDQWDPPDDVRSPSATALQESNAASLSGRGLILTSALASGGCAMLDLALTGGRMTFFFDLCFVVICLVTTMAVRREDLFTAGVLPPLVFAAVIAAVAIGDPHAFHSAPGVNKVFLTGLASHASGLVGGYAVALLAVAGRMAATEGRGR